jgi:hypothetical protein
MIGDITLSRRKRGAVFGSVSKQKEWLADYSEWRNKNRFNEVFQTNPQLRMVALSFLSKKAGEII